MKNPIKADILDGEYACGAAAGWDCRYSLLGVGAVSMRDLYSAAELTAACSASDTAYAAIVVDESPNGCRSKYCRCP